MGNNLAPKSARPKSRRWIVLVLMVLPLTLAATPSSAHTVSISHTPPTSVNEGQDLTLTITVNGDCERGTVSAGASPPAYGYYGDYNIAFAGVKTQCSAMNLRFAWSSWLQDGSWSGWRSQAVQMGPPDALGSRTATLTIPGADVVGTSLYYSISASQSATGPCARVYEDKYPGILCQVGGFTIRKPPVGTAAGTCTSTAEAQRGFSVSIQGAPEPSPSPAPGQGKGQGNGKK